MKKSIYILLNLGQAKTDTEKKASSLRQNTKQYDYVLALVDAKPTPNDG